MPRHSGLNYVTVNSSVNQLSLINVSLTTHYLVEVNTHPRISVPHFRSPIHGLVFKYRDSFTSIIFLRDTLTSTYLYTTHQSVSKGNTSYKDTTSRVALAVKKRLMELCHSSSVVTRDIKWWVNSCRSTAIWDEEEEEKGRHATATLIKTTLAAVLLVAYSLHMASVNIS